MLSRVVSNSVFYSTYVNVKKSKFPYKTLTFLGLTAAGSAFYIYAHDPEFRNKIEYYVPDSKIIFDRIVSENDPLRDYVQPIRSFIDDLHEFIKGLGFNKLLYGDKEVKKEKEAILVEAISPTLHNVETDIEKSLVKSYKNFLTIFGSLERVFSEYEKFIELHTNAYKDVMEKDSSNLDEEQEKWNIIFGLNDQKINLQNKTQRALKSSLAEMQTMQELIDIGRNNPGINAAKLGDYEKFVQEQLSRLSQYEKEMKEVENKGRIFNSYANTLHKAKEQLKKEVLTISPVAEREKWSLFGTDYTNQDLNALLVHAYKKLNLYQKELARQKVLSEAQIEKALENQKQELAKKFDQDIRDVVQNREKIAKETQTTLVKKEIEPKENALDYKQKLQMQLAQQTSENEKRMAELLSQQRAELLKLNEIQLQDKIKQEELRNQSIRKEYISKFDGIERAINDTFGYRQTFLHTVQLWAVSCALTKALTGFHDSLEKQDNEEFKQPLSTSMYYEIPYTYFHSLLTKYVPLVSKAFFTSNVKSGNEESIIYALFKQIGQSFVKYESASTDDTLDRIKNFETHSAVFNDYQKSNSTPEVSKFNEAETHKIGYEHTQFGESENEIDDNNYIATLRCLINRFPNVKRVCSRVAMVHDPDSSLLRYAFSYLQSLFIIAPSLQTVKAIDITQMDHPHTMNEKETENSYYLRVLPDVVKTENELETTPQKNIATNEKASTIRFTGDTFEVLSLAEYYVLQKRDITSAVKVLNLLRGQPRLVADGWINDAIKYLEMQQNLKLLSTLSIYLSLHGSLNDKRGILGRETRRHQKV